MTAFLQIYKNLSQKLKESGEGKKGDGTPVKIDTPKGHEQQENFLK